MMHEEDDAGRNPLLKEVPGHLFQFEERIFGMKLTQLLSDIGAGIGIMSVCSSLPLSPRIVTSVLLALFALVLIHGNAGEHTLLAWIFLYVRSRFVPKHTTWQSLDEAAEKRWNRRARRESGPPVQTTWIAMDSLSRGIAGYSEPGKRGPAGQCWAVLECEGPNLHLLPQAAQVRTFGRYETFLCGLSFRLQFISQVEQIDPAHLPPLLLQKEAVGSIAHTPRLAQLQQASIRFQERRLPLCTITRHFIVVAATAAEEAVQSSAGERQGALSVLLRLLFRSKPEAISNQLIKNQLRTRISVLTKRLQQLDVRCTLLDDSELLQQFARCVVPGVQVPSFIPQVVIPEDEPRVTAAAFKQAAPSMRLEQSNGHHPEGGRLYRKRIDGLHAAIRYSSRYEQSRFEEDTCRLADLISPSCIDIAPDVVETTVRGKTRFTRSFFVVSYGSSRLCGWMAGLTALGLPMVISTIMGPIDSRYLINRLEMQLVRLESRRLADQKTKYVGGASRTIEAEQIRAVARALAARSSRVFAVQMTIGIHAGSLEHLEQRSRYLLSHLREMQLSVRSAAFRQERAWQATWPTCPPPELDVSVNLPSDVLSSFLHLSSGVIGTPTGVFLGFTGSGAGRRPVYFNPWAEDKRIPNPHVVIIGESGMGKSLTGKVLVTGLIGMGIADVVVLDRDDDYLPLHQYLDGESQRVVLSRGCPINPFDLPFAPQDIDPDDGSDCLAEFIDNHLLVGLTLLLCDADTRLSKIEEAYLMHVARNAYASKGITSEAIRSDPGTLLRPMPTLADFIETMRTTQASDEALQASLISRLEKASYLFRGQTSISIDKALTIFSIHDLDEKWYALMTFVVQNFLMRHRALRQDERYLAYVVEEASYMLKHPAGRKYLESGSRGFRKLGIAQITLSQHPREFINEGAVILNNAGTAFYLGMQQYAARELHLPAEELERTLTEAIPGQVVMRIGNEYAVVDIAASPLHMHIFSTTPQEQRKQRKRHKQAKALAS